MRKKKHLFKRPSNKMPEVTVTKKLLDSDCSLIVGEQKPTHIVIHETSLGSGRSPESYNMEYYANMLLDRCKIGRSVGFHYLVGDNDVYQFIPDNNSTEHTGTVFGNHNSIGIERLICKGINYEYAVHNQAKLVATLMLKHNIPIDNVYTHRQMQAEYGNEQRKSSPTLCPQRLVTGVRGTVQDFKHEVERCFMFGWLFRDMLSEEEINKISGLMQIAQKRQRERIENKKRKQNNISSPNKDIEENSL